MSEVIKDKVFLGGTCGESDWRKDLIEMLEIDYFNPVVEDWTPECIAEEERQKKECAHHLYTITPEIKGHYSIAELCFSVLKQKKRVTLCLLREIGGKKFTDGQWRSMLGIGSLVRSEGCKVVFSLADAAWNIN